jgi:Flp pilus assembly protein TadG
MRERGKIRGMERGQAAVELALLLPILVMLLFGVVQLARVYYVYHTLQKAVRAGAGFIAHLSNVNYCDDQNAMFLDARNYIVYGNLEGSGTPVVNGLTPEMVQIIPERADVETSSVAQCACSDDGASCDITTSGRAPDYVVVNLGEAGFPVDVRFPFVNLGSVPLHVSVRMAVTGG